ncbi:MAG: hypothetical protein GF383_08030 [Candidatus Lokiarchaeota archaeon]|nr:hypothetical protein [Candidatus Lokiarchaeota archaeon]MBD3340280.1 hypothetical protein [Candidatus Lokiarchaeota archaeon]
MVEKKCIDAGTPKAGPYNHAVKVGDLIFVSGQGPKPGTKGIKEHTMAAFENVKTILEAAGAKVSNIVKVTVYLKDMKDFKKMNSAYKKFFNNNGVTEDYPARTTVEALSPIESFLIEIDVIAAL